MSKHCSFDGNIVMCFTGSVAAAGGVSTEINKACNMSTCADVTSLSFPLYG